MVTHDLELAAKTGRVIKMKGGKLVSDDSDSYRNKTVAHS